MDIDNNNEELLDYYSEHEEEVTSISNNNNQTAVDALLQEDTSHHNEKEDGEILDKILQESIPITYGPPLTPVAKNFIAPSHKLGDSSDVWKSTLVPENIQFLDQMRVNGSIYPLLSKKLKKENSNLLEVETSLSESSIIQARVMEKIIEMIVGAS